MMKYSFMSGQTPFRDPEVFETDPLPEGFRYRDTQDADLAFALRPVLVGERPLNTVFRGMPGTGKTTAVRAMEPMGYTKFYERVRRLEGLYPVATRQRRKGQGRTWEIVVRDGVAGQHTGLYFHTFTSIRHPSTGVGN